MKTTHVIIEERIMRPFIAFKEDECKGEWLRIDKMFDVVVVATWTSELIFPKGPIYITSSLAISPFLYNKWVVPISH